MLKKNTLLTLSNNQKYLVIDSIIHDEKNFIYIINTVDTNDQSLALVSIEDNDVKINIIDNKDKENKELIQTLCSKFIGNILKNVKEGGI